MNHRTQLIRALKMLAVGMIVFVSASCRKQPVEEQGEKMPPAQMAPELLTNQLGDYPGAVYRSQALSPIRWQPWTQETMDRARKAQRLIFCVIAMPQQPGFQGVLAALANDPKMLEQIHKSYVPVLVDGDAAREMALLAADLCTEIERPIVMPLFLWLTYEGNPVAWIPVIGNEPSSVRELFNQSHSMVSQIWRENPQYVLNNSRLDNQSRRERIDKRRAIKLTSEQPAIDLVRSLRQLNSLYDPYSRSFDESGGLFPANSLELLASSAVQPGLTAETRERSLSTTRELLQDLLSSAMFDPLDGGVFVARRSVSWSLPMFIRDCPTQSRAAIALLAAYRATGNQRALDRALDLIAFSEKAHRTRDGLFAVGLTAETDPEKWMWNIEEVRKILGPEDSEWWIKATGMKGLGNLPSEVDPQRRYFRSNTLSLNQSMAEIAAELSIPLADFKPRFEAARAKLRAVRDDRFGKIMRDECAHAPSTFRMVSTYAAAFIATGDEDYRHQAVSLLNLARESFAKGPALRTFVDETPASLGEGRAFLYALAMQAILDVASITLDDQWLLWSEDLATSCAEWFTGDQFLKECKDSSRLIDLPFTDLIMLFAESTAGLFSMAEARLAELGRPLLASFSELATPLPVYALDRPVLHTDLLLAALARHCKVTVIYPADIPADVKLAVERLPLRMVHRRAAMPDDAVPSGSVKILFGEEEKSRIVDTANVLREAILPSQENPQNPSSSHVVAPQSTIPEP